MEDNSNRLGSLQEIKISAPGILERLHSNDAGDDVQNAMTGIRCPR